MKLSANRDVQKIVQPSPKFPKLAEVLLVIVGLGLMGGFAFFWNLGSFNLLDETEPLFAEAARQMLVRGDWITPYFNEETRFDKPPLIYWLVAIAYRLFGVNEWSARFPSALSAFLLIGFGFYTLYFYIKKTKKSYQYDQNNPLLFHPLPWLGAGLMAFNAETIAWGRIGVSDMLLTACLCSALFAFFLGYASREDRTLTVKVLSFELSNQNFKISDVWYLAFYILVALAVLTKGPVGIVLPVLIIGAFLIYLKQGRIVLKEMRPRRGGLIFLGITLPWYILVTLINGEDYINSFFGYHNLERFTQVVNNHSAPWYFYFIVVLVGFAPFSVYLPFAIASTQFWKRRYWQRQPRIQHLKLFALFWFASIFLFFTIAVTKLPSYVLPLMPAAALLVSLIWHEQVIKKQLSSSLKVEPDKIEFFKKEKQSTLYFRFSSIPKLLLGSILANIVFILLISVAIYWSPHWLGFNEDMPEFQPDLISSGILIKGSLIWVITALLISLVFWKRKLSWILAVNLFGFIAFFIFAAIPAYHLLDYHRQEPLREIAQIVVEQRKPGEELVMMGFKKPSLVFYTQNPVQYHQEPKDGVAYLQTIKVQNSSPETILIVGSDKILTQIKLPSQSYQLLTQKGSYQLIRLSNQSVEGSNHGASLPSHQSLNS